MIIFLNGYINIRDVWCVYQSEATIYSFGYLYVSLCLIKQISMYSSALTFLLSVILMFI